MSLIPWRRDGNSPATQDEFDEFFRDLTFPFPHRSRNRLPAACQARSFPPLNVSESEQQYTVSVELPGMDVKDIQIELMGNQLSISGERKWEEEKKGKEFLRVESQYGNFSRTLMLPENLRADREAIEATFQKGILEIRIPKVEPTPVAKIAIKAK